MRSSAKRPPTAKSAVAEVAERKQRLHRLSLVLHPDPLLRAVCAPVVRFDSTLRDLLEEMHDLMNEHGGIGLAGPQVAIKQRLIVCRIGERSLSLMNPEVRAAGTSGWLTEGCLSLPDTPGDGAPSGADRGAGLRRPWVVDDRLARRGSGRG